MLPALKAPLGSLSGLPYSFLKSGVSIILFSRFCDSDSFQAHGALELKPIHKDFLHIYLGEHLLPFSRRFAERVLRHPTEIATGLAFVPGMGAHGWDPVEMRMRPRSPGAHLSRTAAIGRNLLRFISGKGHRN